MAERMGGTNDQEHQERRRLVLEALQEDRQRTAARLVRDLHRQRTAEAEKSARLRELQLAKEASEVRARQKPRQ